MHDDPLFSLHKMDELMKDTWEERSPNKSGPTNQGVVDLSVWSRSVPAHTVGFASVSVSHNMESLSTMSDKISTTENEFKNHLESSSDRLSDDEHCLARPALGLDDMVSLASSYAQVCSSNHSICLQKLLMAEERFATSTRALTLSQDRQSLLLDAHESRAERDMWSLLAGLTRADLLRDLDHQHSQEELDKSLSSLKPYATRKEVLLAALQADDRLKKTKEVKEWLERAAEDLVEVLPLSSGSPSMPWSQTLSRLLDGPVLSGGLCAIHPDAQIGPGGLFLPLDAVDAIQQEALLKAVWKYVRCGQLTSAQELAAQQGCFWLAAALLGVSEDYSVGSTAGDAEQSIAGSYIDNPNYDLWSQASWFHAEALGSCSANTNLTGGRWDESVSSSRFGHSSASYSAVLETSIYAALSGHWDQLQSSPLVSGGTWADKLWAATKTVYDLETARVMADFQRRKRDHSALYPDCSETAVSGEEDTVRRLSGAAFLRDRRDSGRSGLEKALEEVPAPQTSALPSAEECVLSLQAAVIGGPRDLAAWLADKRGDRVWWDSRRSSAHAKTRLFRLRAHLVLWLSLSSAGQSHLRELVPYPLQLQAVQDYVFHLASAGVTGRSLSVAYATFLARPDRIQSVIRVLQAFDQSGSEGDGEEVWDLGVEGETAERKGVLEIVLKLLPENDVRDILRLLVTHNRVGVSGSGSTRQQAGRGGATRTELCYSFRSAVSSLQWLCLRPSHREEAVRQSLYFGRDSLTRATAAGTAAMPTASVLGLARELHYIFGRTLPFDSAQVATEEVVSSMSPEELGRGLGQTWAHEVRELAFWRGVTEALQSVLQWHETLLDLQTGRASFLGDSRAVALCLRSPWQRLEEAATKATGCLIRALRCDFEPDSESRSLQLLQSAMPDGITDAFRSRDAALLETVSEVLQATGVAADVQAWVAGHQEELDDRQVKALLASLSGGAGAVNVEGGDLYPMELMELLSRTGLLSTDIDNVTAVVERGRLVLSQAASLLLHQYLHICRTTASNAASVSGSNVEVCGRWLQKAVSLADLIADSNPALLLKTILSREDQIAMLDSIKDAAVGVMRLSGQNDFPLPDLL